jgi:hypothetical protein
MRRIKLYIMLITRGVVGVSLFLTVSVLHLCPLQSIDAQTFETNSTQTNLTTSSSLLQWAVYTNDEFGFSVEYPQSWVIEERENRFENTVDVGIIAPDDFDPNWGRFNLLYSSPSSTSNIRVLTNLLIDSIVGSYDTDYDKRLIESANITKYQIGGERAGAFTYVLDSRDYSSGETITTPVHAVEAVGTIHDGKEYVFSFVASPESFDNTTLTNIRQRMFNSIKWLN